jgi:hypothetical protein
MKDNKKISFIILALIITFGSGAVTNQIFFHDTPSYSDNYAAVASVVGTSTKKVATSTILGVPPESPTDYTNNKNGTITDNYTGLIWKQCPQGLSGNNCQYGSASLREWSKARVECENLNFAGKTGWRLPTVKELQSIVYASSTDVAINKKFFVATKDAYWTLTSPGDKVVTKFTVLFTDGTSYYTNSTNFAASRCVYGPKTDL